jgi:hypothetical protein
VLGDVVSNLCRAFSDAGRGGGKPRWLAPSSLPPLLLLQLMLLVRACDAAAEPVFLKHGGVPSASSAVDLNSSANGAGRGLLSQNDEGAMGTLWPTTKARCALARTRRPVSVPRVLTLTWRSLYAAVCVEGSAHCALPRAVLALGAARFILA